MGNISDYLPCVSLTVEAIYAYWKRLGDSEQKPVNALGCSQVGHECERYLWYVFRHCCKPEFDGRMYRLFDRGCLEEERMIQDLQAIGCAVLVVDEQRNTQFHVEAFGGHLSGYLDGCALGFPEAPKTWHVLEFKTHSAKSWRSLQKHGLFKTKPQHYGQCMLYMHLTKMKRTFYLAVNKDTEELYAERIRYNKDEAEKYMAKAERVITASEPPERLYGNSEKYPCSFCDAKHICYGSSAPLPALLVPYLSCRQCCHSTSKTDVSNAQWVCEKHKKCLSIEDQLKPCDDHIILPCLLSTHTIEDYGQDGVGNDYICFRHKDGDTWKHGKGSNMVTSKELIILPWMMLTNRFIQSVKANFGAKVVGMDEDLFKKYPENETVCVWSGSIDPDEIGNAWRQLYDEDLDELEITCKNITETDVVIEYGDGRVIFANYVTEKAEIREREQTSDSPQISRRSASSA